MAGFRVTLFRFFNKSVGPFILQQYSHKVFVAAGLKQGFLTNKQMSRILLCVKSVLKVGFLKC